MTINFHQCYLFLILVCLNVNGRQDTCPYAQFELFRTSKTPLADECETHLVIQHGQCMGATVHIKALGIYTTVVDVQLKTPHCAGKELVEIALLNRTVKVPKKYFGYQKSGCFEFPASMMFDKQDPSAQYAGHWFDERSQCTRADHNSRTLVHSNTDFDNVNTWHSLAHLHSLWSTSTMLKSANRPLEGDVDVTSGQCKCGSFNSNDVNRKSMLNAMSTFSKVEPLSSASIESIPKNLGSVRGWLTGINLSPKLTKSQISDIHSFPRGRCSSCRMHFKAIKLFTESVVVVKRAEEQRYSVHTTAQSSVPEWGSLIIRQLTDMSTLAGHCAAKTTELEAVMEGSVNWEHATTLADEAQTLVNQLYDLSAVLCANASFNSKVLLEGMSYAASLVRRSGLAVVAVISGLQKIDTCLKQAQGSKGGIEPCLKIAEQSKHDADVWLETRLSSTPQRDRYSRGHLCKCSVATTAAEALLLPTNSVHKVGDRVSPLRGFNFSKCYDRHVFIVRHRKTDPVGGWPGYQGDRAQLVSSPFGNVKSCGSSEGAYWNAITGLLWDAKLCGGSFTCAAPALWDSFISDVVSALQLKSSIEALSSKAGTRKVLCYMSRGVGVRGDGMEDEGKMRDFIASPRHSCEGRVLDFTEGSVFFKNFTLQAATVAECDVLIGPHGAGLGHVVWMSSVLRGSRSKGVLLEILGGDTQPWYYHHLSEIAGVDYVHIGTGGSDFESEEGIGLTPNPDFASLREILSPLCIP